MSHSYWIAVCTPDQRRTLLLMGTVVLWVYLQPSDNDIFELSHHKYRQMQMLTVMELMCNLEATKKK